MSNFLTKYKTPERIGEFLLIPTIVLVALVSLFVFRNEAHVPIVGVNSIGLMGLIIGVVLTVLLFPVCYILGVKKRQERLKPRNLIFNSVVLTVATAVMIMIITALLIAVFDLAFKDLLLDRYTSSVIIGAYAGVLVYLLVPIAVNLNTYYIVQMFSVVMICGVALSMITSTNPLWWQENFSSLGSNPSPSALAFNFTLILSGLILVCLSGYILNDIKSFMKATKESVNVRIRLLHGLFIFIGLCMAGVGFFPYYLHPLAHNFSAYSMVIGFAIMIFGLKKILPFLDPAFIVNSFFAVGIIGVCYVLYDYIHYMNLTAFEMTAFSVTFVWLLMFVYKIEDLKRAKEIAKG